MKTTYKLLAALSVLTVAGCATHRIGPEATFVSASDKANPPLEISAAFRDDLCSQNMGYLVLSVRNPTSEWQSLSNTQLRFPYAADSHFDVVAGRNLLAWADAQRLKNRRETQNEALARLAVRSVSRVMMASEDEGVKNAGTGLYLAERAEKAGAVISESTREASMPAGDSSNHLLADELILPPGMDRSFWILLTADNEAPLMNWLTIEYQDKQQLAHQFVVVPGRQSQCGWQEQRQAFLEDWGINSGAVAVKLQTDGRKVPVNLNYADVEAQYQKQHKSLAEQ